MDLPSLEDIPTKEIIKWLQHLPEQQRYFEMFLSVMNEIKQLWSSKKASLKGHTAINAFHHQLHVILFHLRKEKFFSKNDVDTLILLYENAKFFNSMFVLKKQQEKEKLNELKSQFISFINVIKCI